MPEPHTAPPLPFPIPVQGLNLRDALSQMPPTYSPWLKNVDAENGFMRLRGGYQQLYSNFGSNNVPLQIADSNAALTYNTSDDKLRVHSWDGTVLYTTSGTYAVGLSPYPDVIPFEFKDNIYFFGFSDTIRYDGSSWGIGAFTDGSNDIVAVDATEYLGRPYLTDGTDIWFGDIGQVTGELTKWPVSDFINKRTVYVNEITFFENTIVWIGVLTSPGDRANESYLAFGTSGGDVYVYGGNFPNSVGWVRTGKFQVAFTPPGIRILEYQNDIWLPTFAGIASIRRLFQLGDNSEDIFLTKMIEPAWRLAITTGYAVSAGNADFENKYHATLAYNSQTNKILARVSARLTSPTTADFNDGVTHFVFNCSTGAWSIHDLSANVSTEGDNTPRSLSPFFDSFVFISEDSLMWLNNDSYNDQYDDAATEEEYVGEIRSAYSALGSTNKFKHVETVEPIINTDFDGSKITVKAAADFGKDVDSVGDTRAVEDGFDFPVYHTGARGSFLQYRMEITSDTDSSDGCEVYAVSMGVT